MEVSTHSHPKVAAVNLGSLPPKPSGFNTQPPEGGCGMLVCNQIVQYCFNTQHPKVAARSITSSTQMYYVFQHTATRRWLHTLTTASALSA